MSTFIVTHLVPAVVAAELAWISVMHWRAARAADHGRSTWWVMGAAFAAVLSIAFSLVWLGLVRDRRQWSDLVGVLFIPAFPALAGLPAVRFVRGRRAIAQIRAAADSGGVA